MQDKKYVQLTPHQFALCVAIAPGNAEDARLLAEQAQSVSPDFIEWRRDALSPGEDVEEVLLAAKLSLCETTGLIYTYRAPAEGGFSDVPDAQRQQAVLTAVRSGKFDYVDTEFNQDLGFLTEVFTAAGEVPTGIILSHHRFSDTMAPDALAEKLAAMAALPADVIKVALTGDSPDAVRQYGAVVSHFAASCDKPVIYTLMGPYGSVVRALPEAFGGTLTFAAINQEAATAPGQLTPKQIFDIRNTLGFVNQES